jgi:hypothetical protein
MEFKKVTELLELLLIKKNNFSINEDEKLLIEELFYLLVNNKDSKDDDDLFECQCELNSEAIEKEIEMNQCNDCGLPLTIL